MAHLDHLHDLDVTTERERRRTDPASALLFGVLACVVVALALTENFTQLVPASVGCVAAIAIARLEARTRDLED